VANIAADLAPLIKAQPASQTVTAGQTANFSVAADGTAPLVYQWRKNGTAISGAISSSYATPPTTTADNGAVFVVTISDKAGSVTSNPATLAVTARDIGPSITSQPVSQIITAGQTATFSVTASGTAPLSYQWNKNGTAISGATSASYATPAETTSDNGAQFAVVVSNATGNITSAAATLTVNAVAVAPSITSQPIGQTIAAGQTATFSVTASGTAPLGYQWNKNGTAISGAASSSYSTPAETTSDNGAKFTVVISNGAGNVTSNAATLTVNAAAFLLSAAPTSLNFGNVNTGASSTLPVTLTNSGNSNVTISNVSISGPGFNASGARAGQILTPGQVAALNVTFAPAAVGSVTGSTLVVSNATNSPATITLVGNGQPTTSVWRGGFFTDGVGEPISAVPWNKLTHMFLCCAAATSTSPFFSENWLAPGNYPTLFSYAHTNNVQVVLSVGDFGNYVTATASGNIDTFVNSVVNYVNTNGFDGVDLDWENNVNTSQFISLISKLRTAMPSKIITFDAFDSAALKTVAQSAHPNLTKVNVMCYDMANYSTYNGNAVSWYHDAIHNNGTGSLASCEARVGAFTSSPVSVPAAQILVGIPAYGYVWSGCTAALATGCTMSGTLYHYSQILGNSTWWNGGANKHWDNTYGADYLSVTSSNQFITYNDSDSVTYIVNWGTGQGYGGYFFFALDQEYMSGQTGDARFPLTTALYNAAPK